MFGSNEALLCFFNKQTHEECLQIINEKFINLQNFANLRKNSVFCGCTCNNIQEYINFNCNSCYKYSVEEYVITLKTIKDFYPEDFTILLQNEYNEIVKECNQRQINMNEFVMHKNTID